MWESVLGREMMAISSGGIDDSWWQWWQVGWSDKIGGVGIDDSLL